MDKQQEERSGTPETSLLPIEKRIEKANKDVNTALEISALFLLLVLVLLGLFLLVLLGLFLSGH